MPRQPRRKEEHCTYHVILRGNERKSIFEIEDDKKRFLKILVKAKEKFHFLIYAFCLMDNHVHLLINCKGNDISLLMKSINISFAYYYNNKYQRCGHLFQDRFKSELVGDDAYFLQVSKYIHRNPVKAGIVKDAEDYYWSSYREYLGKAALCVQVTDTDKLLGFIAGDRVKAVNIYAQLVSENDYMTVMDIEEDMTKDNEGNPIININKRQAEEKLLKMIPGQDFIKDHDANSVQARNILMKQIRRNSSLTMKEIGALFGGLSESRVSRILKS